MEMQISKGFAIAVKKQRRLAAHHPVQGGHSLLPIQQQADCARCGNALTASDSDFFGSGFPNEQSTHRVAAVQRLYQVFNLRPLPYIATLEHWQGQAAPVDIVQNC